jgi:hypothetical protein
MTFESWFINIDGETFGPLSTDAVSVMLKQNRVHFSDFIWKKSFSHWVRIIDVRAFSSLLPPIPKVPPPTSDASQNLNNLPRRSLRGTEDIKLSVEQKATKLRYFPRAIIEGTIDIEELGHFKLADISEVGVFVAAMTSPDLNTQVDFTIKTELLGNTKMSGIVIRHSTRQETPGFAIQFLKIDQAFRDKVHSFIISEQMRNR